MYLLAHVVMLTQTGLSLRVIYGARNAIMTSFQSMTEY